MDCFLWVRTYDIMKAGRPSTDVARMQPSESFENVGANVENGKESFIIVQHQALTIDDKP